MTHRQIRFTKSADTTLADFASAKSHEEDGNMSCAYPNYEELFEFAKVRGSITAENTALCAQRSSPMESTNRHCKNCDSLKVPERTQSVRHARSQPGFCSKGSYSSRHRSPRGSDFQGGGSIFRDQASRRSLKGQPLTCDSRLPPDLLSSANREDEAVMRLRTFTLDPKEGLINRGDSFRSKSPVPASDSMPNFKSDSKSSTALSSRAHSPAPLEFTLYATKYDVFVIGAEGVGKSALIKQFKTSEYCTLFNSVDSSTEFENNVAVVLDGEESEMTFSEYDCDKDNNEWKTTPCSGYLIVYSVDKESTFKKAVRVLKQLHSNRTKITPTVLVGNKVDLERRRYVTSEEGKVIAKEYQCKFVETSVAIGHNVDKLLAGVLTQARRQSRRDSIVSQDDIQEIVEKPQKMKLRACLSGTATNCSNFQTARQLMNRLSFKKKKNSKSVEDLFSNE